MEITRTDLFTTIDTSVDAEDLPGLSCPAQSFFTDIQNFFDADVALMVSRCRYFQEY
jgi:hypothetical protein